MSCCPGCFCGVCQDKRGEWGRFAGQRARFVEGLAAPARAGRSYARPECCDNNHGQPWACEGGICPKCGGCDFHCMC